MSADPEWRNRAACKDKWTDAWFTEKPGNPGRQRSPNRAIAICHHCPVRQPCLASAMKAESGQSKYSKYGVFGGLTGDERSKLLRNGKLRSSTGIQWVMVTTN